MTDVKRCKCGSTGPFWKNRNRPDGLTIYCVECMKQRFKAWRSNNLEKSKEAKRAWKKANRPKLNKDQINWTLKNPVAAKAIRIREKLKRYGMVVGDWNAMFDRQKGLCAICELPMHSTGRNHDSAAIDHDHETGRVRGLLHQRCNQAIGLMVEDPSRLRLAAEYLEKNHALREPDRELAYVEPDRFRSEGR